MDGAAEGHLFFPCHGSGQRRRQEQRCQLQRLTDKTLFTQFHSFIGTPAYTSPEQAEMSSVDIDTRSDIYSLGVLL